MGSVQGSLDILRKSWYRNVQGVTQSIRGDKCKDKDHEDCLEEAMCLHMHLAIERDHLGRILSQMPDLVAVALMHHGAQVGKDEGTPQTRTSLLKELNTIWNHPSGRHLRMPRDRCMTEEEGWIIYIYEMFQHRHAEKQLGR